MPDPPPLRRPADARPRGDRGQAVPTPPDPAEAAAIEAQLSDLIVQSGAAIEAAPDLGCRLVRWPGRGPGFGHAVEPRWTDDGWQAAAEALAAHQIGLGELPALALLRATARPADLDERLVSAGWLRVGLETVLWTRRAGVVPHLDAHLRLESVTASRAAEYEAVERAIFGLAPGEAGPRLAALEQGLAEARLRAYLVRLDGAPIATARLIPGSGVAALQGVGVVAERRRQGYGSLITTIATRAGLATGHRLVWLACDLDDPAAQALYGGLDYRPFSLWVRLLRPG